MAQLQTLERLQTQTSHRVSRMDIATANEPLNPMAPSMQKLTSCRSRTSGTVVSGFFLLLYAIRSPVSSPFLDLFLTLVKVHLRPIKLLQLALILASDLQQTTNHSLLTTYLLLKIDLLPHLMRLVPLACRVHLLRITFPELLLTLSFVHLLYLKVPMCPRGSLRCPIPCHEPIPSTIYKAT